MIALLAAVSIIVSVVAQSAAAAFSTRLWPGGAVMALGVMALLGLPIFGWLAGAPSDALARGLSSGLVVEAIALAICLEGFLGAFLLWYSTSARSFVRNMVLFIPFPSTVATPLVLAQLFMAHGPRIDLELLGWAGIAVYAVFVAGIALIARRVRRKAPDFLLEACMLFRLIAVLAAAAMIAALHDRPAPVLKLEPIAMAVVFGVCAVFVSYGFLRRQDT